MADEQYNILDLNLITVANKGRQVQGLVYIKEYQLRPRKNGGGSYLQGTFQYKKNMATFKIWDTDMVAYFNTPNKEGLYEIIGEVNVYMNKADISIKHLSPIPISDTTPQISLFLGDIDVEKQWLDFKAYAQKSLGTYIEVLNVLLDTDLRQDINPKEESEKAKRFYTEYAGSYIHDAEMGGLLHHTYKMLRILDMLCYNDNRVKADIKILRLGIILHDIGKIKELCIGQYTDLGLVLNHRALGEEMLIEAYPKIKNLITEQEYQRLRAIIRGHHGEYGEAPQTSDAMIVHLIDMLESQTTAIYDGKSNTSMLSKGAINTLSTLNVNGTRLTVFD